MFFIITGYFVAKKGKDKSNYIDTYIKRTIPLYLMWSLIYIPIILMTMKQNLTQINVYIINCIKLHLIVINIGDIIPAIV